MNRVYKIVKLIEEFGRRPIEVHIMRRFLVLFPYRSKRFFTVHEEWNHSWTIFLSKGNPLTDETLASTRMSIYDGRRYRDPHSICDPDGPRWHENDEVRERLNKSFWLVVQCVDMAYDQHIA